MTDPSLVSWPPRRRVLGGRTISVCRRHERGWRPEVRSEELLELHYITPMENVPSILAQGILSHRRAGKLRHQSIAMPEVQARRAGRIVPGGRPLHDYVNLYICARNPMLYVRQ